MWVLQGFFKGELAERSNAAVLKTVSPQGLEGSNPSLSATSPYVVYARPVRTVVLAAVLVVAAPGLRAACDDVPAAKVDWSGCTKQGLMLRKLALPGARFDRSTLVAVNFDASDLRHATFTYAELSRSSFRDAVMDGANLQKIVAVRSNFGRAQLARADLEKAELHRCVLSNAVLWRANLSRGDFGRSTFDRADLRDANLAYSSFSRASFREARLAGADFSQAFLFGARFEATDLAAVKGLVQAQIDVACGDAKTKLPAALAAPASWPCME
jgi:uncharacterized protein YjbI with pentapeptide repeats